MSIFLKLGFEQPWGLCFEILTCGVNVSGNPCFEILSTPQTTGFQSSTTMLELRYFPFKCEINLRLIHIFLEEVFCKLLQWKPS